MNIMLRYTIVKVSTFFFLSLWKASRRQIRCIYVFDHTSSIDFKYIFFFITYHEAQRKMSNF